MLQDRSIITTYYLPPYYSYRLFSLIYRPHLSTGETLSGLHGDGAHGVLSQVLRHLQHQSRCSIGDRHLKYICGTARRCIRPQDQTIRKKKSTLQVHACRKKSRVNYRVTLHTVGVDNLENVAYIMDQCFGVDRLYFLFTRIYSRVG